MPENRASAARAGLVGTLRLCQPPRHRARNQVGQCLNSSLILRVSAKRFTATTNTTGLRRKLLTHPWYPGEHPRIATSRIQRFQQYAPR
jgi:hypothetical protein